MTYLVFASSVEIENLVIIEYDNERGIVGAAQYSTARTVQYSTV
jgi:hypothetical protein